MDTWQCAARVLVARCLVRARSMHGSWFGLQSGGSQRARLFVLMGLCVLLFAHTGRGIRVAIIEACIVLARGVVACVLGVPL